MPYNSIIMYLNYVVDSSYQIEALIQKKPSSLCVNHTTHMQYLQIMGSIIDSDNNIKEVVAPSWIAEANKEVAPPWMTESSREKILRRLRRIVVLDLRPSRFAWFVFFLHFPPNNFLQNSKSVKAILLTIAIGI